MSEIWSGFFRKTISERRALLNILYPKVHHSNVDYQLKEEIADNMIENCIG
jgi:hydroxymethylglutaryl-CoA reductase